MKCSRWIVALVCLVFATSARAAERPNILYIVADDLGYSDLGCYGGEISTPVLDALAAGGVRLTQFYNTGRCCPSRAAILTGQYPHRVGLGHMTTNDLGQPGYRGVVLRRCPDDCSGACPCRVPLIHVGQVASRHSRSDAAWIRGILWHACQCETIFRSRPPRSYAG